MYNSNTDSLGLILGVEVFFSIGHCSGALCTYYLFTGPAKKVFRVRKRKVRVPPKVQRTAASEGMLRLEAGPSTEKVWEVINMVTSEQEEEEEVGEGDISLLRY